MKGKSIFIIIVIFVAAIGGVWIYLVINSETEDNNYAPVINSYSPLVNPYINETETQEFSISAIDPDGDALMYTWSLNGTEVGGNTSNYIFDANSNPNGTYIVNVVASDGIYSDTQSWILTIGNQPLSGSLIINHNHAHLEGLLSIPIEWINTSKENLNIAYGHTSHGSQLTDGMEGLEYFMGGNGTYAFGQDGDSDDSILAFFDYYSDFGGSLVTTTAHDLGNPNDDAWAAATEEYLDNPSNPGTNVIIWSWCGIGGHNITRYIEHMENLIGAYSAGGSKGRDSTNEVQFVFMTGHVDGQGIGGTNNLQNEMIREHCRTHGRFLFDFADIESYDPDDNYFLDKNVDDACNYDGGNWATEWIVGKTQMTSSSDTAHDYYHGGDWYQCGAVHSHALSANLKAYGCWYLFARLAGWEGN